MKDVYPNQVSTLVVCLLSFRVSLSSGFGAADPVNFTDGITLEGFPSGPNLRTYTIFNDSKTWLEAQGACDSIGESLLDSSYEVHYTYIHTIVSKTKWSSTSNFWIGSLKRNGGSDWVSGIDCDRVGVNVIDILGNMDKCVVMNMTSKNSNAALYASPCTIRLPYLCVLYYKPDDDFYSSIVLPDTEIRDISGNYRSKRRQIDNLEKCALKMFLLYDSFAGEYRTGSCKIYTANLVNFPVYFNYSPSTQNTTLIVKNSTHILFENKRSKHEGNGTTNTLPCFQDTSTVYSDKQCYCKCSALSNKTKTFEDVQNEIIEMKKELKIEKAMLSSSKRRKTCATDVRASPKVMGWIGILVISIVLGFVVISDIPLVLGTLLNNNRVMPR